VKCSRVTNALCSDHPLSTKRRFPPTIFTLHTFPPQTPTSNLQPSFSVSDMAAINKFDDSSLPVDSTWFTTYSRALFSIYPNEEDHCWDRLAHYSSIFTKLPAEEGFATAPSGGPLNTSRLLERSLSGTALSQRERRQGTLQTRHRKPTVASPSTTLVLGPPLNPAALAETPLASATREQVVDADADEALPLVNPGRLSHALCKIGFDCIDYFTASTDDERPLPNRSLSLDPYGRSTMLREDEPGADWRTGLAAAVCGKRTAALERKRVRSRTMSQDHLASYGATRDPWFETLDRLSRWDEVAYR